jgi:methionyl-tRNA synthetase
MDLARVANGYVEERQPWTQAKSPGSSAELDQTLATLARALAVLCALFQPVAPTKVAELAGRLGLDRVPTLEECRRVGLGGRRVAKGPPLFPKIDVG